jgi:hypothetical protein
MSRRFKFQSQAQLNAAYARLLDQAWVDSCTVDVPGLELRVQIADGPSQRQRAEAWIERERRQRRRTNGARD